VLFGTQAMSLFLVIWNAMEYRKEKGWGGGIELIISSFVSACLVN